MSDSDKGETPPAKPFDGKTTHDRVDQLEAVAPVIEERTRKTLSDVRWLLAISLGSVAAVVAATASTIVFAQDAGAKAVAPVARRQDATDAEVTLLKADVAQVTKQVANVERVVLTLDLNMRLMLESRGIKPIDIPSAPKDAGP